MFHFITPRSGAQNWGSGCGSERKGDSTAASTPVFTCGCRSPRSSQNIENKHAPMRKLLETLDLAKYSSIELVTAGASATSCNIPFLHIEQPIVAGRFVQRIPYGEFPSVMSIFQCSQFCSPCQLTEARRAYDPRMDLARTLHPPNDRFSVEEDCRP